MSPLSPHHASRLQQLLRLAAAWLALLLAVQGFQGALVRGAGPLHRHAVQAAGHAHGGFERHHHGSDAAPADAADAALDVAAQALLAALALLALGTLRRHLPVAPMAPVAAAPRPWRSHLAAPARRPPRHG